jgi:hypothetical protein
MAPSGIRGNDLYQRSPFNGAFLMGELINLDDYRRSRDEKDIEELKELLDHILAYLPGMEQQAYFIQDEMVYHMPLSSSQTNLDGYYTDEEE